MIKSYRNNKKYILIPVQTNTKQLSSSIIKMVFSTYYGPNTVVSETCLWIADGSRRICITYEYTPSTGELKYAASVFRCTKPGWTEWHDADIYIEPEMSQMMAHENTTTRRYDIRPVIIQTSTNLNYDEIIKAIRHEMCHGYGCKGPRVNPNSEEDDSSSIASFLSDYESCIHLDQYRTSLYGNDRPSFSTMISNGDFEEDSIFQMNHDGKRFTCVLNTSTNEVVDEDTGTTYKSLSKWARTVKGYSSINVFTSCSLVTENNDEDNDYDPDEYVDVQALESKNTKYLRYISSSNDENYLGSRASITREIFIAYKGKSKNGDLIYGAAISRKPEELGPIQDENLIKAHYETAEARLDYKPVAMKIDEEFKHQLKKNASHKEDIMYQIIDMIMSRKQGKFLIRDL